ncbi:MAG TPA: BON domain-containing protein [Caldimonas sp.]
MKTDRELKSQVTAELDWDPAVKATAIGVAVTDGIVTLTGHLDTLAEKEAATRAVRRIAGVKAVAVELDVRLTIPHKRTDTEIAAGAEHALRWNTLIPVDSIRLTVEHGCVTLQGKVAWEFQRRAAARAVLPLMGVVAIHNEITLNASPQIADVAQRIEDALTRQAMREATHVHVAVEGATVKLTGLVNSWHDREAIGSVAWSAPGVRDVVNELLSV